MRRISSLPISEYCSKADEIGTDVETTNAKRSTVFHAYCETGKWPDMAKGLPAADFEEIQKWRVPRPLVLKVDGEDVVLKYKDAVKEIRVALDKEFEFVEIPRELELSEVPKRFPNILCIGHLDMAWDVPSHDLVVICDIKSSVFAVKTREKSLQLHGYGIAFAKKMGRKRYMVAIWDACDGKYYPSSEPIEFDSFEYEEYKDRIKNASSKISDNFVTGSHCGGCWKRQACPAHLVDVPKEHEFYAVLTGQCGEADIRNAMIKAKKLKDLSEKVSDACKAWVDQHGPVRSEDGTKEWTCALRSGRMTLDEKALEAEVGDLSRFKKKGNDYPVYDWRNRKESI